MPNVRLMEFNVIIGEGPGGSPDSVGAVDAALAEFELWRKDPEQARVTIQNMRFEFITESKIALYITYSR